MKIAKLHEFEGQMLSVGQIAKMVPALSQPTIRTYLSRGIRTRQAMLSYNPIERQKAGARRRNQLHPHKMIIGKGDRPWDSSNN